MGDPLSSLGGNVKYFEVTILKVHLQGGGITIGVSQGKGPKKRPGMVLAKELPLVWLQWCGSGRKWFHTHKSDPCMHTIIHNAFSHCTSISSIGSKKRGVQKRWLALHRGTIYWSALWAQVCLQRPVERGCVGGRQSESSKRSLAVGEADREQ